MSRHIFLSYRRADSEGYAGRLFDRLSAHFGRRNIFMDVVAIDAGVDFSEELKDAVQGCDVLLALIGPAIVAGSWQIGEITHYAESHWLILTQPLGFVVALIGLMGTV